LAFLVRAFQGLELLLQAIDTASLTEATAAPTPYGALVRALESASVAQAQVNAAATEVETWTRIDRARLRGLQERRAVLEAEGGAVPTEEAARLLGVTPQAVNKRRKAGKLIGLSLGRRGYLYPVWQFERSGTLPHLSEVLDALPLEDEWMQAIFLLGPNERLDGSRPLDELRRGNVEAVLRAARTFGEHGAA
jgi:hypothetical protein